MNRRQRRRAALAAGTFAIPAALALLVALAVLSASPPARVPKQALDVPVGGLTLSEGKYLLDVNAATAEQLTALPGIGEGLAEAIVRTRAELGGFGAPEDVALTPGIGEGRLAAILNLICAGPYGG